MDDGDEWKALGLYLLTGILHHVFAKRDIEALEILLEDCIEDLNEATTLNNPDFF